MRLGSGGAVARSSHERLGGARRQQGGKLWDLRGCSCAPRRAHSPWRLHGDVQLATFGGACAVQLLQGAHGGCLVNVVHKANTPAHDTHTCTAGYTEAHPCVKDGLQCKLARVSYQSYAQVYCCPLRRVCVITPFAQTGSNPPALARGGICLDLTAQESSKGCELLVQP